MNNLPLITLAHLSVEWMGGIQLNCKLHAGCRLGWLASMLMFVVCKLKPDTDIIKVQQLVCPVQVQPRCRQQSGECRSSCRSERVVRGPVILGTGRGQLVVFLVSTQVNN